MSSLHLKALCLVWAVASNMKQPSSSMLDPILSVISIVHVINYIYYTDYINYFLQVCVNLRILDHVWQEKLAAC